MHPQSDPPQADGDPGRVLADAAAALRRDAAALRGAFQRAFDAADPVPGVEEARRLAQVLDAAATRPPAVRDEVLRTQVGRPDLELLQRTAESLDRAPLTQDIAERQIRTSLARQLRDALAVVQAARTG